MPRTIHGQRIHIILEPELAARLDLLAFDPVRRRTGYGARSAIIKRALIEYFQRLDAQSEAREEITP
ncbi:MAG: hypothetical protein OXL41_03935 [Nitrospinae bacterium]|nr:hypothetical protein [Nitrospinota bacterium]